MTSATRNGTIRKSLADQIDRLDNTLDGLSSNLNEAVASAVKEAGLRASFTRTARCNRTQSNGSVTVVPSAALRATASVNSI